MGETRDMRRYEIMEIKHGRAAMLGFLHVIAIEAGVRVPGYLSTSQNLKFSDVLPPLGVFDPLGLIETRGHAWHHRLPHPRAARRRRALPDRRPGRRRAPDHLLSALLHGTRGSALV